ncbi:histidine phosphatase family protein [Deinococcus peraridilitoris]|uniref:Fructose-2,6-bisphosphatase n=1 Tax=Deinococcus peraridilitoris (strain DSM 19664 / LMG 22246 / CIP 109416 / KR-200) TaxID=937777 RepID=L0A490_DEIPD|nr:histidine phosphatase family protein [Deinococcus peraridilitoris]AFZ68698.1 fructose-2,6-bisphosphatase [Deinococcus peraridilitoris DSM 19664]
MPTRRAPTGFEPLDHSRLTEFWVVRHAESEWNASGRYQGQTDVPLSQTGREQAARLAGRLTGMAFDAVYSSDLIRAFDTARTVAATLRGAPEVRTELGLREIDVGELAGKVPAEIKAEFPEYIEALRLDPWNARRPGGESMADLSLRARAAFDELCERHHGERVLMVTHGGVVRVAVSFAIGEDSRHVWARLSVANTAITRVALGPAGGQLLSFNDVAHLERVQKPDMHDDLAGDREGTRGAAR